MLKKTKAVVVLLCALMLVISGVCAPVAHAATVVDSLTVDSIFDSLGEATQYGVVAREWDQGGHAETNACVDVLDRHVNTVFSNTDSTYFHALGYLLEAEVTAPANPGLNGMTFALFKESEDGTDFVLIEGSQITVNQNVATATLSWDIDGLSDDALKDLKNTRLYVKQVNADGTYVSEGGTNAANLVVNYGPSISASAYNSNYIGKIYYSGGVPDSVGIFNTTGNTPGIVLGAATRLYYQNSAGEYVQFDPEDTTISTQYVMVNVYYGDPEQMTYAKLDGISFHNGVFSKNGDVIKISYSDETSRAADLLEDAEAYSKYLGNIGGGEITSLTPNPEGTSTVHGPLENGQVLSLYDVEVGSDGVFKVKDDMGWDGIPVAANEYVVINLICPSKDGEVLVGPGASDITYFYEEGQQTGEGVQWGTADSNSSQRVIFNFVYADENGVMQPFEGTIVPHSRHGGTLLAPKANVSVTGEVHNGAIIADTVYNGQEIHQRSLSAGTRSTWVRMNGGYLSLQKASYGYDWSVPPYGAWEDMSDSADLSGAVFGVYSDESCSEESLVITFETDETGVATSEMISAGTYWVKEITPLKDHNLLTSVFEVTVVAGQTAQVRPSRYNEEYDGYYHNIDGNWVWVSGAKLVNRQNNGYASLRVLKNDEFGNVLQGAEFGVYTRERINNYGPARYRYTLVASGFTNRNGVTIIEKVPLSYQDVTYYIREISAPDGYSVGSNEYIEITLSPDDRDQIITIDGNGNAEGIAFVNNVIRGNMALKKVDSKTNANLEGAEFTIYSDKDCTQVVGVMTTKKEGDAHSREVIAGKDGLIPGTYYVKETKAPDGYMANDKVYTVTVVADKMVDVVTGEVIPGPAEATAIGNDQAIHLYGTKVWYDEGYENNRPNEVKVALYKGTQFLREVTVSAQTGWKFEFLNLPRYDENGDEIEYSVRENLAGKSYDYYAYVDGIDGSGNVNIVVANSIRRVEITGEKAWEDGLDYDPNRPETITFLLYQQVNGELVPMLDDQDQHMTVTGGMYNNYKFEFKNLPFYDATGIEAAYVVQEAESGQYLLIDSSVTKTEDQNQVKLHFTLTNRLTVSLAGTKVWQDSSDYQGKRPENVTLVVYCNNVRMNPQPTIVWDKETDADVWAWSIDHLPKYGADNSVNTYTVQENAVRDYTSTVSEDGLTFYNTITGNIQLYKRNDTNTTHLNGAQFKLYYDAECQNPVFGDRVFETASRNNRDGWLIIENVVPGDYYILEVKAPLGYALPNPNRPIPVTVVAGVNDNRVNSHLPEGDPSHRVVLNAREGEDTTIEVNKTWVGDAGKEDARPQSVTIQLYQNGTAMDGKTLELNASNNWSGEFTKLPSVDENDASYVYTVKEAAVVPGYVGTVSGSVEDGFTVTNTYNNTDITVTKKWEGPVSADDMDPVEVRLLANGTPVDGKTVELSTANSWTFTFQNLPIADETGKEFTYTVEETTKLADFVVTYSGDKDSGFVVTNTAKVGRITLNKVKAENYEALGGAKFGIYSDAGCTTLVGEMTTGNDGVATSGDLLPGIYYVKETEAPSGYKIDKADAVSVTVKGDETVTAVGDGTNGVFTNTQGKGKLYVKKVGTDKDGGNAAPLAGAEFTVYQYPNGQKTEVGKMITDENGYGEVELPMGSYMVQETKAPDGYKINDSSEKWVNIERVDQEVLVQGGFSYNNEYGWFQNTSTAVGSIKLTKVSAADANVKLAGAVFGVYSDENCQTKVGEMTTDANGEATYANLEANRTYYIKEITAPAGYELNTQTYAVTVAANTETAVNGGNPIPNETERAKGAITLTKVSAVDANTKLAGAVFTVYSDEACTTKVGEMTTDSNGVATYEGLYAGETYWVKETKAPSGYVLSDTKYSITVVANITTAVNEGNAITNEESEGVASIYLYKVATDTSGYNVTGWLAGAEFDVYTVVNWNKGEKIGSMTTDANGMAEFTVPAVGTYIVVEAKAPAGYERDNNEQWVTVYNEGDRVQVTDKAYYSYNGTNNCIGNKKQTAYLELYKLGAEFDADGNANYDTMELLSGVEFTVTAADGSIDPIVLTTVNGYAKAEVPANMQLAIQETKVPEGYELTTNASTGLWLQENQNYKLSWWGTEFQKTNGSQIYWPDDTYNGSLINKKIKVKTGEITFSGTKTLTGKTLEADAFSFVLKDSEGNELETVKNAADGSFTFTALEYTADDVGKTYSYTVTEVDGDAAGVTYDKTEYTVTVTVADNGSDTLTVTADIDHTALNFTNTYAATGKITFSGTKTLTGKTLEEGAFSFVLSDNAGKVLEIVKNDADGSFAFTALEYELADLGEQADTGKTFTYTVKELKEDKSGIVYDSTVYTVEVTVTDNGDGTLNVTAGIDHTALNFSNKAIGGFKFTKQDEDGNALAGAVFGVYAEEGCTTKLHELTSDANGIVAKTGLDAGTTYYIKEITAPAGYVLNETVYSVNIEAGVDDKLVGDNGVITNTLEVTNVTVTKVWVGGASIDLSNNLKLYIRTVDEQNNHVDTEVTGKTVTRNGDVYTWSDLAKYDAQGNLIVYVVKEDTVPDGYTVTYEKVEVGEDGDQLVDKDFALNGETITNTLDTTDLRVAKNWHTADGEIDNENLSQDVTDALLLYILSADGTETLVTDADGNALKPVREEGTGNDADLYWWRGLEILPEGSQYIVKEEPNKVPDGFVVDYGSETAEYVTFQYDGEGGFGVLYNNTFNGFVIFVASKTVDGQYVNAAFEFELVDTTTQTVVAQGSSVYVEDTSTLIPGMTQNMVWLNVSYDADDLPATADGVKEYYYILREVAGTGAYVYDTTEYEFKVTIDGTGKVTQYIKVGGEYQPYNPFADAPTFNNQAIGGIKIVKVDESNQPVAGAQFGIYFDAACTDVMAFITTDENGVASRDVLVPGQTYYVKEISAPTGYVLDETIYPVTIEAGVIDKLVGTNGVIVNKTTKVNISGTKVWVDDDNANGKRPETITIWLYADGVKTDKSVTISSDETTWSFNDLPEYEDGRKIVYTVQEEPVEGYTTTYSADTLTITNALKQGEGTLSFLKMLSFSNDRTLPEDGYTFTFTLTPDANTPDTYSLVDNASTSEETISITPVEENGKVVSYTLEKTLTSSEGVAELQVWSYLKLIFTEPGTYTFTLQEKAPEPIPEGWFYDTTPYTIQFVVNDGDDQLNVERKDGSGDPTIYNELKTIETSVYKIWKDSGYEDDRLETTELPEYLYARYSTDNGTTWTEYGKLTDLQTQKGITVDVQDRGYGTWFVNVKDLPVYIGGKEVQWSFVEKLPEGSPYETVYGTDNDFDVTAGLTGTDAVNFCIYNIHEVEVTFAGTKSIVGREMNENDIFTFEITEQSTGKTWTVQNDANGNIQFPTFTYGLSDVGEHWYTVCETSKDGNGVKVDTTVYEVYVEVMLVDNALELNVQPSCGQLDFTNTYEAVGETTFAGTKTIKGRNWNDGDIYSFEVYEAGRYIAEAFNDLTGKINYPTITYTQLDVGTHVYTIREISDGGLGLTADNTVYTVTVTVTDNGDGTLKVDAKGDDHTALDFVNTYKAEGEITLSGVKTLTGKALAEGDFSFELLNEDGTVIETVTNDADGNFAFTAIEYNQNDVGSYIYMVQEVNDEQAGVTYDETVYTMTVTVSDNGDGTLDVTADIDHTALDFTNAYAADGEVQFSGNKMLTGKALAEGDFSFVLSGSDGTVIETVQNDADGKFTFPVIEYDLDDVGQTFTYTVKELDDNKDGVTYDKTVHTVTVKVSDNGDGTLKVEASENATVLSFTNTYKAEGEIIFAGTKTIEGRELKTSDKFTFEIKEGDKVIATVENDENGKIAYPTIAYTLADVGTHTYTVKETSTGGDGITVDATEYTVTVTVTDNGDGTLKVEVSANAEALDFTNTYEAAGEIELEGTKSLIGRDLAEGEFSFELKDEEGTVVATATNDAKGKIVFTKMTYATEDIGKTYTYTASELPGDLAGVSYDSAPITVKVAITDNGDGTLKVVKTTDSPDIVFTNTYSAEGEILLAGTKSLSGRVLKAGEFSFQLYDEAGILLQTATNDANGAFAFKTIKYELADAGKTFTYTVKEVQGKLPGVTYDENVITVKVQVTDVGGKLSAVLAQDSEAIAFTNTYEAEGEITFAGKKSIDGRDMTPDDVFTFEVKEGTDVLALVMNGADGVIAYPTIQYTLADVGTHTYLVREINTDGDGITVDTTVYTVTVEVSDNGDGTLTATASDNATALDFTNTYAAEGEIAFGGSKTLTGKALEAEAFSFQLIDEDGTVIETVKNDADGKFAFTALTYDLNDAGETFTYTVKEVNDGKAGITYDKTEYTVTVEVSDNGNGTLTATASDNATALDFTNTYAAEGEIAFGGSKTLTGKALEAEAFSFQLIDEDGTVIETVKNDADGKFAFTALTYDLNDAGETFTYTVKEVNDGKAGITYDKTVYTVTVKVDDNGDGTLSVTASDNATALAFTNTYAADGSVQFAGSKTLTGKALKAGDFSFELIDEAGTVLETVQNDADGKFAFTALTYDLNDAGETFTYTVKEVNDGKAGITYDKTVYTVTVKVDDNGDGTLSVTASDNATALAFTNTYAADGSVQFAGSKTLTGKALKAGDFSFELIDEAGTVLETVQNDADGKFSFTALTYDLNDAGETFTYTVKEVNDGKAGITYDKTVYTVTVKVDDNGDGTLSVTASDNATALDFTNTYAAAGTTQFSGWKALLGREFAENDTFTFELMDEAGTVIDTVTITPTSGISADFEFKPISYDLDDVGTHTYTYRVKEQTGDLEGMTYDATVHTVTVKVTDAGDGTLKVETSANADKLGFTNTYAAEGAVQFGGTKTLNGKTLNAGDFSFILLDEKGNTLETAKNDANGSFVFGLIEYELADAGKTFTYTVKEVNDGKGGVTYDTTEYTVTVEVIDNGDGTLTATASDNATALNFTNTYAADGEITFSGSKTLTGKALEAEAFSFELIDEEGTVLETVKNDADGKFAFTALTYDLSDAGKTFTYTVKEVNDKQGGVIYDDEAYTVIVEVSDNGNGTLSVTATENFEALDFTNAYTANGEITFSGSKALTGKALNADDFSFELIGEDGTVLETVKNDADGKFTFTALSYKLADAGKTFTYTVKEVNDGKAGITYDKTVYTVTVEVDDNGDGTMNVTASDNAAALDFTNTYEASAYLTVEFGKTVDGKEPTDEQVYDFVLEGEGVTLTAQNENGLVTFDKLFFDLSHVGKTLTYTIRETTESSDVLLVDSTIFTLTLTIADNGNGELALNPVITRNDEVVTEKEMIFNNQLLAHLTISKKVEGLKLDEAFDMIVHLYDANNQELTGTYAYDGDVTGQITSGGKITLADGQKVTIKGLPEGATYKVTEDVSKAYTTTVNGKAGTEGTGLLVGTDNHVDFVNKLETTTFEVEKVWEGGDLGTIILTLFADGVRMEPQPVVDQVGNKYTYRNLPKFDENGDPIVYTAKEKYFDGYITIYRNYGTYEGVSDVVHDGGTIVNRKVEEKLVSFKIQKIWTGLDANEAAPEITLVLYSNGVPMDLPTPKPDKDGWYKYYDLPASIDGVPVVYTVEESSLSGYTTTYMDVNGEITEQGVNGGQIVNARIPQTGDNAALGLWMTLMSASAVLLVLLRRRKA